MSNEDRAGYIKGLRALADALEQHPDVPLPFYGSTSELAFISVSRDCAEELAAISRGLPCTWESRVRGAECSLTATLHGLKLGVLLPKGAIPGPAPEPPPVLPSTGHAFVRPGQVAPDRPAPDRCMQCGLPGAVHAAPPAGAEAPRAVEALTPPAAPVATRRTLGTDPGPAGVDAAPPNDPDEYAPAGGAGRRVQWANYDGPESPIGTVVGRNKDELLVDWGAGPLAVSPSEVVTIGGTR